LSLTRVSPALFQVSNNITSVTVGGSANTISLTFDSNGVITGASNNALSVANTAITGLIQAAQIGSANATLVTSGTLPAAALPAGSVLQVVSASTSTQVSSASTARVDTGLTATITPTKNTSTILVVTSCRIYCATSSVGVCSSNVQLLRGATTLQTRNRYGLPDVINVGAGDQFSTSYLDSPATTSATTYKVTFNRGNGNAAVYAQLDSDMSTITLMEIQG
jgi:hypothetical protein